MWRASASHALATSQSWPCTRAKTKRSARRPPAARMCVFMSSTQVTKQFRSSLGNGGSATRCTTTPARTSSVGCSRAPRVRTCTSTPSRTSPSDSLRTWRPSPPSTMGGYSQETISTRGGTARRSVAPDDSGALVQARAADVARAGLLAGHGVAPRPPQADARRGALLHRHDDEHLAVPAQVGTDAVAGVQSLVGAGERLRAALAQGERRADEGELRRGVREGGTARAEVHGAAVVGVHEREVLQLVAAVDVGDAGRRELEQRLAEGGAAAGLDDARAQRVEVATKAVVVEQPPRPALHALLVLLVLVDPVRRELRLPQGLLQVAVEAVQRLDRVGAEQRLEHQEAGHRVGRLRDVGAREGRPVLAQRRLGEGADARADVAGALRVMRAGDQQVARPALGTQGVRAVKLADGDAEAAGV